jgi:hypothetical protein
MSTCSALANDREAVARLWKYYWAIEKNATPMALLLPQFPSPARRAKNTATKDMYTMVVDYIDARRIAREPSLDTIGVLISEGKDNATAAQVSVFFGFIEFLQMTLIVRLGHAPCQLCQHGNDELVIHLEIHHRCLRSFQACWTLLHLGANPEWKHKITSEIAALVSKYTDSTSADPFHKRLSTIPLHAWETELPILDLVLQETIRFVNTGTLLRRNIVSNFTVSGKNIEKGAFIAYSLADAHMNPDIYSNPRKFDPNRFLESHGEDRKRNFSFLGWGAGALSRHLYRSCQALINIVLMIGRHPCAGQRVAKLEIKMITVLMIGGYDYELVDTIGAPLETLPEVNRNDIHMVRGLMHSSN